MKTDDITSGRPWSAGEDRDPSRLRRAITTHLDEPMVTTPAAPMLGELLTRLDEFSNPRDVGELRAPEPPGDQTAISQGEASAALHDACGALRDRVLSGAGATDDLEAMLEVIEDHLSMKSEVVARSTSDPTPG